MGVSGSRGEYGILGQAYLSVGPVQWVHRPEITNCDYCLSGGGKIESSYKLIRFREVLLAWDFKTLQFKQIMNWGIMYRNGILCTKSKEILTIL